MAQVPSIRTFPFMRRWFDAGPTPSLRQEMDDLIETFFGNGGAGVPGESMIPRLDVSETADAVEVTTDVPGFKPEEINIDIGDNYLTLSGEHSEEKKESQEGRKYHRVERRVGSFSRSVWLPCPVQEDKVEATVKDGVLTIKLPKAVEAKRRKVPVSEA